MFLFFFISSLHDCGGSGGLWSNELMDLQVDYWLVAGNKKDINKVLVFSLRFCDVSSPFVDASGSFSVLYSFLLYFNFSRR